MSVDHIVLHGAVLGPPHTDRTFLKGELVSEADFEQCPEQWERLIRLGAIRPVYPHEADAALAARERNLRDHLGVPAETARREVEELSRLRRQAALRAVDESPTRPAPKIAPDPAAQAAAAGSDADRTDQSDHSDQSDQSDLTAASAHRGPGRPRKAEE